VVVVVLAGRDVGCGCGIIESNHTSPQPTAIAGFRSILHYILPSGGTNPIKKVIVATIPPCHAAAGVILGFIDDGYTVVACFEWGLVCYTPPVIHPLSIHYPFLL